ncbi:hypothetical protein IQ258_30170, partial [Coleofasciculus sp. LEGE 07081]|nr:hypothetical protein [Coleofasciculus sp. LEGE 07081]
MFVSQPNATENWFAANQDYLMGEIARVRQLLQHKSNAATNGLVSPANP